MKQFDRALHDQATRRQWFLLVLIVAAAFALRIWGERESMFIDEIASVHFARVPIATLWSDWMVRETNPPLFYALLGLWTDAVGDSDFAMRILPIIFSCAGIVLIFLLGTRLFNVTTGLTAAALTAVSAQNVFFGQQVRGYSLGYTASLAVFLACVMLRDQYRGRERKRLLATWGMFVVSNVVALYCHTTLFVLPLLANVWLLWALMRDRSITRSAVLHASIANLIILGLWAWWVRITILQLMMPRLNFSWIVKPPLPYAIRLTLEAWFPWEIGVSRFIVAAFAAGLIAWAVYKWRERASLPAFIVIAAPIIFFVASQSTPIYVPRTIFWMSAPFFLLVAAGLCALPTRQAIQIAVAIALSISAVNYALWLRTSFGDPWAEVVRSIERVDPDGLVLVEGRGAGLALERYCEISRCKLQIATLRTTKDERWTSGFAPKIDVNPEEALSMLRSGGRAIFVNWLGIPPQTLIGQVHILKRIEVPGLSDGVVVSLIEADGAVSSAIAGSTR